MKKLLVFVAVSITMILACTSAPEEVAVSSVSLNQARAEMVIGETVQLSATVLPENATNKSVTWSSSNKSVAMVDNGTVVAIAEGSTNITASAGGKFGTCAITVRKTTVAVTSVELNKSEMTLIEGDSETLTAAVKPDDATDKTVMWSTSDAAIAKVENSKVTAIKEGTATILAKAGEKEATCKVVVVKRIYEVESVTLNKSELYLNKGMSESLIATVSPDNATDKTVIWSTSNAEVATVDNGKVTAIRSGSAIITATAGEKSAICSVSVKTPVESISLDKTNVSLEVGQSTTIVANVVPADADDKTVSWSTDNPNVAIVTDGIVTAISKGAAIISAYIGDKKGNCTVEVKLKVLEVEDPESFDENHQSW